MRIFSYWHQGQLRRTDWVCLESWLAHGFEVALYTHDPETRVPMGVDKMDAQEVLDKNIMQQIAPLCHPGHVSFQPVVNFSDLFRMQGMSQGLGLWLDTDVFVIKAFSVEPSLPFMGWEGFRRIGSPVLYLPQDSAMLADYQRCHEDLGAVPHWTEWRKSVWRPLRWRLRGIPYRAADLGITIYGNYAFTMLSRKHYSRRDILPKSKFYAWIGNETKRFYTDPKGIEDLEKKNAWGIHVHRKSLDNEVPVSGSIFDKALRQSAYPL